MHSKWIVTIAVALCITSIETAAITGKSSAVKTHSTAHASTRSYRLPPVIEKRQRDDDRARHRGIESPQSGRAGLEERPPRTPRVLDGSGRTSDPETRPSRVSGGGGRPRVRIDTSTDLAGRPERQDAVDGRREGASDRAPVVRTSPRGDEPDRVRGDTSYGRPSGDEHGGGRVREDAPGARPSRPRQMTAGGDRPVETSGRAEPTHSHLESQHATTHASPQSMRSDGKQHASERVKNISYGPKGKSAISTLAHAGISQTEMPDFSNPFEGDGEGGSKSDQKVPTHAKQQPVGSKAPPNGNEKPDTDKQEHDKGAKESTKDDKKTGEQTGKSTEDDKKTSKDNKTTSKESKKTAKGKEKQTSEPKKQTAGTKKPGQTDKSGQSKQSAKDTKKSPQVTEKPARESAEAAADNDKQPTKASGPEAVGKSTNFKQIPLTELKSKYPKQYSSQWKAAKGTIKGSLRWYPTSPSQWRNLPKAEDDPGAERAPVRPIAPILGIGLMPIDEE